MDPLLQALMQEQQNIEAENPMLNAAARLNRTQVMTERGNPWANLAAAAGQGIVSGVMRGAGEASAAREYADFSTNANNPRWAKYDPLMAVFNQRAAQKAEADKQAIFDKELTRQGVASQFDAPKAITISGADGTKQTFMYDPRQAGAETYQRLRGQTPGQSAGQTSSSPQANQPQGQAKAETNAGTNLPPGMTLFAESRAQDKNPFAGEMPAGLKEKIVSARGMLQTFKDTENALEAYGKEPIALPLMIGKHIKATDAGQISSRLDLLSRFITRAFEGGRPSDFDTKTYNNIVQGNWTAVDAKGVHRLVRQAREMVAQQVSMDLESFQLGRQDPRALLNEIRGYGAQSGKPEPAGGLMVRDRATGQMVPVTQEQYNAILSYQKE